MKSRNIIAIATVMALLAVLATPCAAEGTGEIATVEIDAPALETSGHMLKSSKSWDESRGADTAINVDVGTLHVVTSVTDAGSFLITRSLVWFDLSGIGDLNVLSANISLTPFGVVDDPSGTTDLYLLIPSGDVGTTLDTSDYNNNLMTGGVAAIIPLSSLGEYELSTIPLTTAGVNYLNSCATRSAVPLYIVHGADYNNQVPPQSDQGVGVVTYVNTTSLSLEVEAESMGAINMLAGDTFSYTLETNCPAAIEIISGDLSAIGLSLNGDTISGTAKLGQQSIIVRATSIEGPAQVTIQLIDFTVYNPLTLSGSIQATNVDGASYSSQITVSDVDPGATGEVTLSLNSEATTAGYTLTKNSETSWALTRTSAAFISGEVPITITATTSAGGIAQTKTLTGTVNSYYDVKFTTTPSGHRGTGLNVWLIEGDGVWTYRPEAGPAGTTISVSGLVSGITWSGGVLTVSPTAPLDTTTVTITATSPDGYSSTTQVLNIRVWDKLVFTSRPSVENIITTVDGRNVTATAQAMHYASILWDMGDGTTYEGNETITHEYAEYGQYTITATALHVLGYTAAQSVDVRVSPPSVMDGLKDMWPFVAIIGALFVMIMLFAMMRG